MANWTLHSLLRGIRTTRWPVRAETTAGITPGRPIDSAGTGTGNLIARCPTGALSEQSGTVRVNLPRCIHCGRCRQGDEVQSWQDDFQWASETAESKRELPSRFRRSIHVRYIDAGACGGCMGEVRLIDAPAYNMHRFGIFITPTPRNADVLLVAGPVTEAMREPLRKTFEAMPEPRRVVAMGACAIDGGIFGRSYASAGGAAEVIPVDYVLPGCPPPPLAIVDALLRVSGQSRGPS